MAATLPSSNGEAQLVVELYTPAKYAHDAGFESSIHLRGRHWDGDHRFPFSVSIAGLWMRAADLTALHEHISRWLRQPLEGLLAENLSADLPLARVPGQIIRVRFGPRSDTISGLNPVVTVEFSAGALRGQFHFVTDQSCLALFAKELSAELGSV